MSTSFLPLCPACCTKAQALLAAPHCFSTQYLHPTPPRFFSPCREAQALLAAAKALGYSGVEEVELELVMAHGDWQAARQALEARAAAQVREGVAAGGWWGPSCSSAWRHSQHMRQRPICAVLRLGFANQPSDCQRLPACSCLFICPTWPPGTLLQPCCPRP